MSKWDLSRHRENLHFIIEQSKKSRKNATLASVAIVQNLPEVYHAYKIIPRAIFFCALQIVIFPSSTSLLLSTYKQAIFLSYLKKQK